MLKAAEKGDTDQVRSLIEAGFNVNVTNDLGETALILASKEGHINTVRLLIEAGAGINLKDIDGKNALDY